MKAKEMFGDLGYKVVFDTETSLIYEMTGFKSQVIFHHFSRKYSLYALSSSVKLHQAITQQMKELGWIE